MSRKRTDTERLDWLQRNYHKRPKLYRLRGRDPFFVGPDDFKNLRDAIDAAMNAVATQSTPESQIK